MLWTFQLCRFWKSSLVLKMFPQDRGFPGFDGHQQGLVRQSCVLGWHHHVPEVWRGHGEGVHFVGTGHDENQGDGSTRAHVFYEDVWICPVFPHSWSRSTRLATRVKESNMCASFCVETLQRGRFSRATICTADLSGAGRPGSNLAAN